MCSGTSDDIINTIFLPGVGVREVVTFDHIVALGTTSTFIATRSVSLPQRGRGNPQSRKKTADVENEPTRRGGHRPITRHYTTKMR